MGGDVYNSIKNSEGFKHCYDKKFLNKRLDMQRNVQINQNYCELIILRDRVQFMGQSPVRIVMDISVGVGLLCTF